MKLLKSTLLAGICALSFAQNAIAAPIASVNIDGYEKVDDDFVGVRATVQNVSNDRNYKAGMFELKVGQTVGGEGPSWLIEGSTIYSFCVEVDEFIEDSTVTYDLWDAKEYFEKRLDDNEVKAKSTVNAMNKLLSSIDNIGMAGRETLSRVQAAIWELAYDADSPFHLNDGVFRLTQSNDRTNVFDVYSESTPLSNSSMKYDLYVLSSGAPIGSNTGKQDQLIWVKKTDVSAPSTVALFGLAIALLGWRARRA